MVNRAFIACLVVISVSALVRADGTEIKKTAKGQAETCQAALLKGDYDKLVDLTHPKIVEAIGGRKKMIEKLSADIKEMKAKGFAFKSVVVGEPSETAKGEKGLYIVVPFKLEMTVPDGKLVSQGILLGISSDGGKTWVFADTTPGRDALKKVFTDLPDALVIPKKERPTFVKD